MMIFFKDRQVFWTLGYFSVSKFASYSVFLWNLLHRDGFIPFLALFCVSGGLMAGFLYLFPVSEVFLASYFLLWMRFIWAAACCFNCVRVCAQSALDDTFVSGSVWSLSAIQKHKSRTEGRIYINGDIKRLQQCSSALGVSQQSHGTTSLNPKLICPHRLQQAGRKELPIVFCFCLQLHK